MILGNPITFSLSTPDDAWNDPHFIAFGRVAMHIPLAEIIVGSISRKLSRAGLYGAANAQELSRHSEMLQYHSCPALEQRSHSAP